MSTLIEASLIGQSIKQLRLSRNWTQEYLADHSFYSVRNIRRIENEGTKSIDVVNTFAELFGVSALDILDGDVFCLIKKHWRPSSYNTYSNLLFTHVHAGLSIWERPLYFQNGLLLTDTTGGTRLPTNLQRASETIH